MCRGVGWGRLDRIGRRRRLWCLNICCSGINRSYRVVARVKFSIIVVVKVKCLTI